MSETRNVDTPEERRKEKKNHSKRNYIISLLLVVILTGGSLLFAFYGAGDGDIVVGWNSIIEAIASANIYWLIGILGILLVAFLLDGLVIYVFARLYTRKYRFYQGFMVALIGAFYNNVTPSSSGGQPMQAYYMKTQGIEISNAASIMVMWFICYQLSLISLDIVAIGVEWQQIMSITSFAIPGISIMGWNGEIPMVPLIIIGFVLNLSVIGIVLLMSLSRRFQNFVLHYIISGLAKIHLLKRPDKTRENLRVHVENFRMELKRLFSNIPAFILVFVLLLVIMLLRFSVPYFAGLALDAYGYGQGYDFFSMWDGVFRSAFHQMVTGLIPTPGSAGVSELFFTAMFNDFYLSTVAPLPDGTFTTIRSASANMMTIQIIWRFFTYYLVLLFGGIASALYRSRPKETYRYANRQTFVDLQLSTFEERRRSVNTLYETRQLSRQAIMKELQALPSGQETGDPEIDYPLPQVKKETEKNSSSRRRRK